MELDASLAEKVDSNEIDKSFFDFAEEVVENVFKYLDCRNRSRMRLNKRLYGIEERMKKLLEDRERLSVSREISYFHSDGLYVTMCGGRPRGRRGSELNMEEAIYKINRLLNIFKFKTIELKTSNEDDFKLVDCFSGINSYFKFNDETVGRCLTSLSTISKLMQISEVVDASTDGKRPKDFTVEDLNQIYEIAKNTETFCGFAVSIPPLISRDFMRSLNVGFETEDCWEIAEKREGQLEIRVKMYDEEYIPHCRDPWHRETLDRFIIYKYGSEAKYPGLRDRLLGDVEAPCHCEDYQLLKYKYQQEEEEARQAMSEVREGGERLKNRSACKVSILFG
ncbi:hypothetical protein PMAYCL1PPCAC_23157, partial [Pristionchus mayeri]